MDYSSTNVQGNKEYLVNVTLVLENIPSKPKKNI